MFPNADIFHVNSKRMEIFGVNVQTVVVELVLTSILIFFWKRIGKLLVRLRSKISQRYARMLYTKTAECDTMVMQVISAYILVMAVFLTSLMVCLMMVDDLSKITGSAVSQAPTTPAEDFFWFHIFPVIFIVAVAGINLLSIEYFARQVGIYNRIIDYKHELKIVRPCITERALHQIEQQWALMESKEDYEAVCDVLRKYVREAKEDFAKRKKVDESTTTHAAPGL